MHKRAFFHGGSAMAVALSLCAIDARAATAEAAADTNATSSTTVQDIVVVAEKREEKLETVPVAISAFTAKQRDILGIKNTQDLSDFTPGLSYYNIADRAYIRGIGRNSVNLATASGVATYYDGVYYGANATIAEQHDSLFVSNIEVDRGPQNTLHGSNADGGVLNYITARPAKELSAEVRAGVQNYGYAWGEAVVNLPMSDDLRFQVGGNYSRQTGGYFKNLEPGFVPEGGSGPQGNGGEWYYVEGQVDWHLTDHLDAWAKLSSGDYNTNFHTVATIGAIPEFEFPTVANPLSPSPFYGLCGLDNNTGVGCAHATGTPGSVVPGTVTGPGVFANAFPGNNPSTANPHRFIETSTQRNTQNDDLAFATIWTYHFPGVDLQYTGGYQKFNYNLFFGPGVDAGINSYQIQGPPGFGNLTVFPAGEGTLFIERDQYFSNELDLTSTGAGPLQWQAGLYQYHEQFAQPIGAFCFPNQPQLKSPVFGVAGFPAAAPNPDGCAYNQDGHIVYTDYAGFAHFSYKFNDQWRFQGGVRYTADHKAGQEFQRLIALGFLNLGAISPALDISAAPPPGSPGTFGVPFVDPKTGNITRNLRGSWSGVTGDAEINWTPDSETLAYMRYSRGYKAGGFNAGVLSAVPITQPESVDAFELGAKKTLGSMFQLNGAAFYYNYANDQQPFTVLGAGSVASTVIVNIPNARIYGLELEGVWRPIDPLTFNLQYSYLNAKVSSRFCVRDSIDPFATLAGARRNGCPVDTNAAGTVTTAFEQDLNGATLPEAPANKVSFNAQYAWVTDPGTLTLSASAIWKDKTYGSIFNRPQALAPAYSTVNLRAVWDDAKKRYTLIAFVNNVTNTIGYDNVTESNAGLGPSFASQSIPFLISAKGLTPPLTFGAEIQVRFR
jgi:iron complex outermembrane receptor protein